MSEDDGDVILCDMLKPRNGELWIKEKVYLT